MSSTPLALPSLRRVTNRSLVVATVCAMVLALLSVAGAPAALATPVPLAVSMTATPDPVSPGERLTYTVTVVNSEPQVSEVRLTDQLTGLKDVVLTSSRGYCQVSNLLVTCEAGSMPGHGSTWTVTFTAVVTAAEGTWLDNTATVTASWSPQNTSQDYAVTATTRVPVSGGPTGPAPDLATAITAPTSAAPGAPVSYTLSVYNAGGANASDVHATATLPPGFAITKVEGTSLFDCTASAPVVTCRGGTVDASANATIVIDAVTSGTTPAPGQTLSYETTGVVDPEDAIDESQEDNNTSSHLLRVPASPPPSEPLVLTKTAASSVDPSGAQARPQDTLTYTITVSNTGTSNGERATRVQLTDGVQGLDAASVSATSSDPKLLCSVASTTMTCAAANNNYTLNPGEQVVVTVRGTVVQPPSSVITNLATLQALQSRVSITRTATVSTMVRPGVDLSVTTYATCTPLAPEAGAADSLLPCPPFRARNQFDYLVTVGNNGLNDATGVRVRVPLPAGVIFESAADLTPAGGFACTVDASNVVSCVNGTVPGQLSSGQYPGTTRQLRLHLTAPNETGAITAVTTVDPFNRIAESNETNNSATTTTPILTGVDLSVTQAVRCPRDTRPAPLMCDPAAPSGTLIYVLQVQNLGTQDASGIKVTDLLPVGTRVRSAKEVPNVFGTGYTPTHGLSCTTSDRQVDCTGGRLRGIYAAYGAPPLAGNTSGTPDSFTIEVTAFAPAPFGPSSSPGATGSPILNQVLVDPDRQIPEISDTNDLNILETNVGIPPSGDWGSYHELTVKAAQTSPADGAVAPNGTLVYTLTVSNWGSDPVTDVTVHDDLPQGARFRNVTAAPLNAGTGGFACSYGSGRVTCTSGSLAAAPSVGTPTSTSIAIRLFAPPTVNAATTQYTNHALVDPGGRVAEADETNNASDVPLTVELPAPDGAGQNAFNELTVVNTQTDPASGSVAPNGTLKYTLEVKNSGSDPVSGVTVYDYLPQGARFRDVTADPLSNGNGGFVCSFNAGLVTCTSGALRGGGSTKIAILLFAPGTPDDATTHYTNHAVVDPEGTVPEANEDNNVSDVPLTVELPPGGQNPYNDLQVSSQQVFPTADGDVAPSGTLIYRLTIQNAGSDPVSNVVVRDYLPAGTTFRSARFDTALSAGSSGFACRHSNGTVECSNGSIGSLSSGAMAVIEVLLHAPAQPAVIHNQVAVDPDNQAPEADETNNTGTSSTTVALGGAGAFIDLSFDDFTATPDPVGTDQPATYTLTVVNQGTDDAFNVELVDTLPEGSTFVSADDAAPGTSGAFTCTPSGLVVTCSGGHVAGSGGTRTISIVARSPRQSDVTLVGNATTMTNTARIDPDNDIPEADETDNGASVTVRLLAVLDLTASNDGSGCSGKSGDQAGCTWSFTVTNAGPDDVTGVVVRTDLPVGVIPLDVQQTSPGSGTAPQWACQISNNPINQVLCQGDLPAATGSVTFGVKVYVTAESGGSISSTSTVDPDESIVESDEANNTASDTQSA